MINLICISTQTKRSNTGHTHTQNMCFNHIRLYHPNYRQKYVSPKIKRYNHTSIYNSHWKTIKFTYIASNRTNDHVCTWLHTLLTGEIKHCTLFHISCNHPPIFIDITIHNSSTSRIHKSTDYLWISMRIYRKTSQWKPTQTPPIETMLCIVYLKSSLSNWTMN